MKNRVLALCLAAALLFGLMPAMRLVSDAVAVDASADAIFTQEAITVDGALTETSWKAATYADVAKVSGKLAVIAKADGSVYVALKAEAAAVSVAMDGKSADATVVSGVAEACMKNVPIGAYGSVHNLTVTVDGTEVLIAVTFTRYQVNTTAGTTQNVIDSSLSAEGVNPINGVTLRTDAVEPTYPGAYGYGLLFNNATDTAISCWSKRQTGSNTLVVDHTKEVVWESQLQFGTFPDVAEDGKFSIAAGGSRGFANGAMFTISDSDADNGGFVTVYMYKESGIIYVQVVLPTSTAGNAVLSDPIAVTTTELSYNYMLKFVWGTDGSLAIYSAYSKFITASPAHFEFYDYALCGTVENATFTRDTAGLEFQNPAPLATKFDGSAGDFVDIAYAGKGRNYVWSTKLIHRDLVIPIEDVELNVLFSGENMVADNVLGEQAWLVSDYTAFGKGALTGEAAFVMSKGAAFVALKTTGATSATVTVGGKSQTVDITDGITELKFENADLDTYEERLAIAVSITDGENTAVLYVDYIILDGQQVNTAAGTSSGSVLKAETDGAGIKTIYGNIDANEVAASGYRYLLDPQVGSTISIISIRDMAPEGGNNTLTIDHSQDIEWIQDIEFNAVPELDGGRKVFLHSAAGGVSVENCWYMLISDSNTTTGGFIVPFVYKENGQLYLQLLMPGSAYGAEIYNDPIALGVTPAASTSQSLKLLWGKDGSVAVAIAEGTWNAEKVGYDYGAYVVKGKVENATWTRNPSATAGTIYNIGGHANKNVGGTTQQDFIDYSFTCLEDTLKEYGNGVIYVYNSELIHKAAAVATPEIPEADITYAPVLGDNIAVNFGVTTDATDGNIIASVGGKVVSTTPLTGAGTYAPYVELAAAQMNDVITLEVVDENGMGVTKEYTVREYALTVLADTTGAYDDVKPLVKAMLNYGAAAQTYFEHNANNLASAGVDVSGLTTLPAIPSIVDVEDYLNDVDYYGASLIFVNKTTLRFYFKVTGDISAYTFKAGLATGTLESVAAVRSGESDYYYVDIVDINPQDLDNRYKVVVKNEFDLEVAVTYGPMNYVYNIYNNAESSAELKALMIAMYNYYLAADAYVNA